MSNEEIKKELDGIAPRLGSLEKKNPFETPANYFEELPMAVRDRISARKTKTSFDPGWLWRPQYAMITAVLIAVLSVSIFIFTRNTKVSQQQMAKTTVPAPKPQPAAVSPEGPETLDNIVLDNVDEQSMQDALATVTYKTPKATKKIKSKEDKQKIEEYILDHYDESNLIEAL